MTSATKYETRCIWVSRQGPDVSEPAICGWQNVVLSSILFGCEPIPVSETTLKFVENIQAQVAKYVLGLPQHTANFCAQSELGWKPLQQVLYEKKLCFFPETYDPFFN